MKEVVTLRSFYKNPSGGSASALALGAARYGFERRYELVTKKLKKKIPVSIFRENDTSFYFHILVPSDTRSMTYDVVVHFFEKTDDPNNTHMSMKDWQVEFFSNCPSFVFTYAYAYNRKNLLIDFLSNKLGSAAVNDKPTETNPGLHIMWDKSIFYAIHKIMTDTRLSQRYFVKRNAGEFNVDNFTAGIRPFEAIMGELSGLSGQKMDSATLTRKLRETEYTRAKKAVKNKLGSAVKVITGLTHTSKSGNRNSRGKIVGKPKIGGRRK